MDGEPILTCPRRWIKDEPELSADMFWYYHRYKTGLLPEDGGLHSQPHKMLTVMRVMEAAFNKVDKEERDKRNRKAAFDEQRKGMGGKGNPYRPQLNAPRTAPGGRK